MGRAISQFSLLIWKNFVLQKRKVLVTCFELGLPLLFAALLMIIRAKAEFTRYPNSTLYDSFYVNHLPENLTFRHMGLPTLWQMAYSPNTSEVTGIIENMERNLGQLGPGPPPWNTIVQSEGFPTEDEMVSFLSAQYVANTTFLGGIAFHRNRSNPATDPKNYTYSIRLSSSQRNSYYTAGSFGQLQSDWETGELYSPLLISIPRYVDQTWGGSPNYMEEGFLPIQHALDKAIMQVNDVPTDDFQVKMQRYPYPPYTDDLFLIAVQTQLPLIILLSLVYPVLNITRSLVYEKEKRLKESMKMMGLHNWLHWSAWFVRYLIQLTISVFIMTILLTIPASVNGAVLAHSNPFLVFLFLELFAIASMSLAFLLSTLFKKANSSTAGAGVVWFITYSPYFFIFPRYSTMSRAAKMIVCLLSNDAMALGTYLISMYEGTGAGLTFDNFSSPVSSDDNLSMLDIYLMFIVDIILYLTMTWYIEAVFPGEFGIPRPWYFPLMRSYWCGRKVIAVEENEYDPKVTTMASPTDSLNSEYIEEEPVGMTAGIEIRGLRKVFKGEKVAVNDMTINMYEGQITALLGHNGAGKTTTLSMLTGLFPPTKGTAVVNGHDICSDIDGVHQQLGLCPQHDVLYDNLTVHEHLYFFAKLKGCQSDSVQGEIDHYINALQLEDKRHVMIKALSGGMKRKLSVGIALIAGSKIIMLDEPTSGMDPSARRFTWDILQQHRAGRTILLTTHFMDEADLLGDRIAIMAEGRLQCVGSSLFLKKKYGVGYHMSIAKAPSCLVPDVITFIKGHVRSAQLESDVGAELSFVLPKEEVGAFEALFTQMEERKDELGINSYGASVTTMEEVFLKVGQYDTEAEGSVHSYGSDTESQLEAGPSTADKSPLLQDIEQQQDELHEENPIRNSGLLLYWQQYYALFIKRFIHSMRNWLLMIFQLMIPIQCTLVALLAAKMFPKVGNSPPLAMDISIYGNTTVPYQVSNVTSSIALGDTFSGQFQGTGTGTEFLNQSYPNLSMVDFLIARNLNTTVSFNFDNLIGATFASSPTDVHKVNGTALFNNQPYHTAPASLSATDNAFLKNHLDGGYSITAINHPLPRTVQEQASDQVNKGVQTGFAIAYNMLFGMSFLAASFVVFLIKENTSKSKHLQFVSGVRTSNFWVSAFSWDLLNYAFPCVLSCVLFAAFNVEAFSEDGRFLYTFLLLFLHGWAIIPLMYMASFLFSVPSTGFVSMTMFNVIFGSTTFLAVEVLMVPELNLVNVGQVLDWVFVFSPSYLLGKAMADLYNNYQILTVCNSSPLAMEYCKQSDDFKFQENYLAWEYPGIGRSVVFMALEGFLYLGAVLLMEMGVFRRIGYLLRGRKNKVANQDDGEEHSSSSNDEEDQDVRAEREQIERSSVEGLMDSYVLLLKNLRKVYPGRGAGRPPVVAVEGSTLGVPSRECFGLLGVNGAGKTSTFKMLTGDEALSGGDAFVGGFSIKSDTRQVQQRIGYCPQFDGLIDQLTGRETLFMYARLRGVPEGRIALKVNCLLRVFNMEEHADKQVKAYSGGNKRKLSTAVALIGDPPIVLLDEPSTGMDPVTRRLLWKALCEIRDAGRSIVLTSHSMEECEALCTRLAIMVNGSVKCLGSTQHLKSRFGQGYTLLIKVSPSPDGMPPNMQPIKDFVASEFRDSHLKDEHQGMVHYHITDPSVSWATIFGTLERAKVTYQIEDYSVSQTSLEQVFLNFARMQREEELPIA